MTDLEDRYFPGEKEAISQVIHAGRLYGYGNMIYHLKQAWSEHLQNQGISKESSDMASGLLDKKYNYLLGEKELLKTEIDRLKGELELTQTGCGGSHQHEGSTDGHAHGHNTMWFVGNPRKLHHHHDEKCLIHFQRLMKKAEARLNNLYTEIRMYLWGATSRQRLEDAIKQAVGEGGGEEK